MPSLDILPRYLNGPEFCQWAESEGIDPSRLTPTQKRRWFDWKNGKRVDIYCPAADHLLTDHYLHALIPDELWSEHQTRYRRKKTPCP